MTHNLLSTTETLLAQAQDLLAIPSTADNPAALRQALDYIRQLLVKHPGITIEEFEQNGKPSLLAYAGTKRPARFTAILSGHIDVLPATQNQFTPRIHEGKLYARGALDMKVAALVLTNAFMELAPQLDTAIGLQITTDEEVGGYDGALWQIQQGVAADFIIIGERSGLNIAVAEKGISWVSVGTTGISEHAGYPWLGENALTKLTALAEQLRQYYPVPTEATWVTTMNVAEISTPNHDFNRIPDRANMHIDFRHIPSDPHFASPDSIRTFITSLLPDCKVEIPIHSPSVWVEETDPYVKQLAASIEAITQQAPQLTFNSGTGDVRHYAIDRKCAPVEFGLLGEGAHGTDEYVEIDSIGKMYQIMEHFLKQLHPEPTS